MTVRIVTDSTVDMPPNLAQQWGIVVVPLTVVIAGRAYREGLDIDHETFYKLLVEGKANPTTSAPSVGDFLHIYEELARETDEILSIHISSKLSATYSNARLAAQAMREQGVRVEVVDSRSVSLAMGFVVMAAARAVQGGAGLEQALAVAQRCTQRVHLTFVLDTLEYLRRGGRIGRARALLGTMLRAKPILSLRDGEVHPEGRVRTRAQALERLYQMAVAYPRATEVGVGYTTTREEAEALLARLAAALPQARAYLTRIGPVVGTHGGPGVIGVGVMEGEE